MIVTKHAAIEVHSFYSEALNLWRVSVPSEAKADLKKDEKKCSNNIVPDLDKPMATKNA